ncbi:uncharacterized protein LOC123537037 [Mercenaria mercenaria]|uniref:uncharacterized protein LOC123537037 n=1 Tax=Mercenaria mercenaria TaxID=6596 RepID=UPI00234F24E4|nr:uncharacterized protein LOC123537037 [Mercenaria mercenaria]
MCMSYFYLKCDEIHVFTLGSKKLASKMKFHLVILAVLLAHNIVHGDEDDTDTVPTTEQPELDTYCLEPPPTLDGPCNERKIWTFDNDQRQCVQISGCFEDAGPEYNMFMSKENCQRWCA